ncbi:unnamed protein product [Amoebophrya sp. A120]|nr:unnamed protein product [Amoebophrya sp. A120]|eukprot:GSA120T00015803001.1
MRFARSLWRSCGCSCIELAKRLGPRKGDDMRSAARSTYLQLRARFYTSRRILLNMVEVARGRKELLRRFCARPIHRIPVFNLNPLKKHISGNLPGLGVSVAGKRGGALGHTEWHRRLRRDTDPWMVPKVKHVGDHSVKTSAGLAVASKIRSGHNHTTQHIAQQTTTRPGRARAGTTEHGRDVEALV